MQIMYKLLLLGAAACLMLLGACRQDVPEVPSAVTVTPTPAIEQPILVNFDHPIPANFTVELVELGSGQSVSAECYDALQQMLEGCRRAGHSPVVISGYRSITYQAQLFENKVSRLMQAGYSHGDADRLAATEVARPGTSEHHTGLAADIVDSSNYNLDESQERTPAQQWLLEHCWDYGFILRYPKGKSDITGIIYEPWHYRYVGTELSQTLRDSGQCLEEYLTP